MKPRILDFISEDNFLSSIIQMKVWGLLEMGREPNLTTVCLSPLGSSAKCFEGGVFIVSFL